MVATISLAHPLLQARVGMVEFALAELRNGHLCILRDGDPVEGCRWRTEHMSKAVARFRQYITEVRAHASSTGA